MSDTPQPNVHLVAHSYALLDLFKRFKNFWPRYQTVFAPNIAVDQVGERAYTTRFITQDEKFMDGKVLPLFAYTRGPLQRLEEQEVRYTSKMIFPYTDPTTQQVHHMGLKATLSQVDVHFRVLFKEVADFENFESNYLNNNSINIIRTGNVKLPYVENEAKYTLIWSQLEDVDWADYGGNYIGASFNLQIIGPSFIYTGERRGIEKIIFEIRDYQHPDIVYSVQEFDVQPRPPVA